MSRRWLHGLCGRLLVTTITLLWLGLPPTPGVSAAAATSHLGRPRRRGSVINQDDLAAWKLTKSRWERFRQKCRATGINKRVTTTISPRQRQKNIGCDNIHRGSLLTFWRPTPERVSRWFYGPKEPDDNENDQGSGGCGWSLRKNRVLFNHDCVGLTNPCLHIRRSSSFSSSAMMTRTPMPTMTTTAATTTRTARAVLPVVGWRRRTKRPATEATVSASSTISSVNDWWPEPASGTVSSTEPASSSFFRSRNRRSPAVTAATQKRSTRTTASSHQTKKSSDTASSSTTTWRVIRLCQRVGYGAECYQRVRDAALAWEFQSVQGDQGMLSVQPPPARQSTSTTRRGQQHRRRYMVFPLEEESVQQEEAQHDPYSSCLQIWSGPGKRFVTYTSVGQGCTRPLLWLMRHFQVLWLQHDNRPSSSLLYCVNPVAVLYDLVDQRGPGTTYSSTAYATTAGHWLRGEERVTVAWRDAAYAPNEEEENGREDAWKEEEEDADSVHVELLSYSRPGSSLLAKFVWPIMSLTNLQNSFFRVQMAALEAVAKEAESSAFAATAASAQAGRTQFMRMYRHGPQPTALEVSQSSIDSNPSRIRLHDQIPLSLPWSRRRRRQEPQQPQNLGELSVPQLN